MFTDTLELDLATVEPSLAGPKRPQDRVLLTGAKAGFAAALPDFVKGAKLDQRVKVEGEDFDLGNGDVVIAAITSCTNTSNPSVLIAAGLVARKAREKGPEGEAVGEDLAGARLAGGHRLPRKAGLQDDLDALGFNLVGYGCTTCIGNSGPLPEPSPRRCAASDLVAAAVLSGNRNFEGRVNPDVRANYLASPPLVVAYALAGTLNKRPDQRAAGQGHGRQARLPARTSGRPRPRSPS